MSSKLRRINEHQLGEQSHLSKTEKQLRKTHGVDFWPPHIWAHMYVHITWENRNSVSEERIIGRGDIGYTFQYMMNMKMTINAALGCGNTYA